MWLTVVGEAVAPEPAFAFAPSTDVKFKVDPGDEECGNVIKHGEEVSSKSDEAEGGWW
jgi:hypothetical protein